MRFLKVTAIVSATLLCGLIGLAQPRLALAQSSGWLESGAPNRRIIYLQTMWADKDIHNFQLVLRFTADEIANMEPEKLVLYLGPNPKPLEYCINYYNARQGLVLTVLLPHLASKQEAIPLQMYYGGNRIPNPHTKRQEYEGANYLKRSIDLHFQPEAENHLSLAPQYLNVKSESRITSAPGLIRPAISMKTKELLQIQLPDEMRKSDDGWTFEVVARDDSADAKNHIGSLLSAWPDDLSGSNLDNMRLLNMALINYVFHISTTRSWLTKAPVDTRQWHAYTVRLKTKNQRQELFLDGNPAGFSAGPETLNIGSICIGSWCKSDAWKWNGLIDHVRITSEALPDDWLRASGLAAIQSPLFITYGPQESVLQGASPDMAPKTVMPEGGLQRYTDICFSWTVSPEAQAYTLSVWETGQPHKKIIKQDVQGLSFRPDNGLIEPGIEYQWNVETIGSGAHKLTSATATFRLPPDPKEDLQPLKPYSNLEIARMRPVDKFQIKEDSLVGGRITAAIEQWALRYPQDNPDLTRMLTQQWRSYLGPCAWWGDAYGKFLTGAVLLENMSKDSRLETMINELLYKGIDAQEVDGYLGALPKDARLTGSGVQGSNWDLSNIMHQMNAFLYAYELRGRNPIVLDSVMHLADLLCTVYGKDKSTVWEPCESAAQCNWGVLGPLVRLYRLTGRERYLALAEQIVDEWESQYPTRPEWITLAEQDKRLTEMHATHALEMIYCFEGMLDLYEVTKDERLKKAAIHWWDEMHAREVMAHGNLAPEESWRNDPFSKTWAETCVVTAYMRLSIKVLELTGRLECADDIEKGFYNAYLGAQHPSGRHWCYPVPVNGKKRWGYGSREDNPDIACCFNYGMTGLGLIPFWGAMISASEKPALILNYFGAASIDAKLADSPIHLEVSSRYPAEPDVEIRIQPKAPETFPIWLRIPSWSHNTTILINGVAISEPRVAGQYCKLTRSWKFGDTIKISFDFSPRYIKGERESSGEVALYRGPLLLTADLLDNPGLDMDKIPAIDIPHLTYKTAIGVEVNGIRPWVCQSVPTTGGNSLIVRDFATSGIRGGAAEVPNENDFESYAGWIPAK